MNGGNRCSGRIEIKFQGQWGTVCDDNFNLNHASVVCKQLVGSRQVPRLGSKALHDPVPSCLFESMCSTYCRHAGFLSFWLWQTWPFSIFTSFSMLYLDCCPHPHLEQDPVMAFLLHGPSPAQSSSSYALVPLILSMLSLCQWWSRHSVLP